jgi:hypothetical protein
MAQGGACPCACPCGIGRPDFVATISGAWALFSSRSRARNKGRDMRATPGGVKHRRAKAPQLGQSSPSDASTAGLQTSKDPHVAHV